jgi:hypothetical protein
LCPPPIAHDAGLEDDLNIGVLEAPNSFDDALDDHERPA